MEGYVTFLQDIQDAYATLSDLTVIISDEEGREITNVSNYKPLSKIAFSNWVTQDEYRDRIQSLATTRNPSIFVNNIGAHVIVAPIKVNEQATYYIFAGPIIRTSDRELVKQYIHKNNKKIYQIY